MRVTQGARCRAGTRRVVPPADARTGDGAGRVLLPRGIRRWPAGRDARPSGRQPLGFVPQRLLDVQAVAPCLGRSRNGNARRTPWGPCQASTGRPRRSHTPRRLQLEQLHLDRRRATRRASGFFRGVGPGYLQTIGVPWRDGRDIRPGEQHTGVAVVNEAFARGVLSRGQNPVGRVFHLPWRKAPTGHRDRRAGGRHTLPRPPRAGAAGGLRAVPSGRPCDWRVRPRLNAAFLVRATTPTCRH